MKKLIFVLLICYGSFAVVRAQTSVHPDARGILYVDSAATGAGTGRNWNDALTQLADAFRAADSINRVSQLTGAMVRQIWIAKGTYTPLYSARDGYRKKNEGRNNAFVWPSRWYQLFGGSGVVSVYGGFAGTETSPADRNMQALFSQNRTVLSGDLKTAGHAFHVVVAMDNASRSMLNGLVIEGGKADADSSIKINGTLVRQDAGGGLYGDVPLLSIDHCIFTRNQATNGAGIYNKGSRAEVSHTTFSDNFAYSLGGGAYYRSTMTSTFTDCSFTGNTATGGAGLCDTASKVVLTRCSLTANKATGNGGALLNNNAGGTYLNCLFSGNAAAFGGAICNYNNGNLFPYIIHCTLAGNKAPHGASIFDFYNLSASPVLFNSIVWGNSSSISAAGNIAIDNSILQSDALLDKGNGNVIADPLFVHATDAVDAPVSSGNYRLQPASPAHNVAHRQLPANISYPATDLDGQPRSAGFYPDMGAYELQGVPVDTLGILYVNAGVSKGKGTGASWSHAMVSFSDALLAANAWNKDHPGTVKQIWVAKGTYTPRYSAEDGKRSAPDSNDGGNNAFVMPSNVKIYGGFRGSEKTLAERAVDTALLFGPNATILDGQNKNYHVVVAAGISAGVLDGFVIRGGNAAGIYTGIKINGKIPFGRYGAGMYCIESNVSVLRCKFAQNAASSSTLGAGAGMATERSNVSIQQCTFQENNASAYGAGLYNSGGSIDVADCLFLNNSLANLQGVGGAGMYNENIGDSSKIINSLFSNNTNSSTKSLSTSKVGIGGGGLYNHNASPLISHCRFLSNTVFREGGAIYNEGSQSIITYCTFENNQATEGGGIYNLNSPVDISHCQFLSNKANRTNLDFINNGGAIYNKQSNTVIINSSFIGNLATSTGGAIENYDHSVSKIAGCLFVGNQITAVNDKTNEYEGTAVYNHTESGASLINCTLVSDNNNIRNHFIFNVESGDTCTIVNSILWGMNAPIYARNKRTYTNISYSIVQLPNGAIAEGEGNMNEAPLFLSPTDTIYRLKENSPAIAAGNNSVIRQYHLPNVDREGNPWVVNGDVNIGAFASSFVRPADLTALYDQRDTVTVTWKAILPEGEAYVGGDDFKLERSTDSTFQSHTKTVTSSLHYNAQQKNYSIADDITDISGGLTVYYRLSRTLGQNQDWQHYAKTSVAVFIATALIGDSVVTVDNPGESPMAAVYWQPFVGVWTQGTQFNLVKMNKTDGTEQSISIDEATARRGRYTDKNIPTCKEIRYRISVQLGNHFVSPDEAEFPDSVLTMKLAAIAGLGASKGYYPDRTTLRWTTTGSYDHYRISRKVYGSSADYEAVQTIEGAGLNNLQASDDKGTPGVYYLYAVTGLAHCSTVTLHSDTLHTIGFRSPTGIVYGRVTYDQGGGAVQQATVRMESQDNTKLGGSMHLDGQPGSRLVVDSLSVPLSDSAFTLSVWIKPDDTQPKNQIIFAREGQYVLGFNGEGKLYFRYNGEELTAAYPPDPENGYVHLAAIHKKDSLTLMRNDSILSRKTIVYQRPGYVSRRVYIGSNSDGGNFKGYVDEMRLWNVARDSAAIAKDYTRLLTGGEKGLVAYWRFDAGIADQFFDLAHDGDVYTKNDGSMDAVHASHTTVIPSPDQLSLKAYTDSTGNYTIAGIPYAGINGTTYTIAPLLGTHNFDPVAVTRIFSSGSSTFTLDFKDKSSYRVSGYVFYEKTNVPVQGVQFKIDGAYAFNGQGGVAQSDERGAFTLSVPVGQHDVQAVKANHVFAHEGKILDAQGEAVNYQQNLANLKVQDRTTVRFIGRVAGGAVQTDYPLGFGLSTNILGQKIAITLKSKGGYFLNTTPTYEQTYRHSYWSDLQNQWVEGSHATEVVYDSVKNQIVIYPDTTTGEFEAELIPAAFMVTAVDVSNGALSVLDKQALLDLTDSLITQKRTYTHTDTAVSMQGNTYTTYTDTVAYNASYVFTRRVDPQIVVQQSLNPGNPNTVAYFGDTTSQFSTMGGSEKTIPLYNTVSGTYTFDHPVFRQNVTYGLKITSYEPYPYYNIDGSIRDTVFVPSSGGIVTITNDLKAGSGTPDTVHVSEEGVAYYDFLAGEPDFSGSGLKGFAVSVQIGSQTYQWNKGNMYMAYLFGGRQTGTNFVTDGPKSLIGILRDPPGSESYASLQKNAAFTVTSTMHHEQANIGSASIAAALGNETKFFTGTPFIKIGNSIEFTNTITGTFSHEEHWISDSSKSTTVTFNSGYQTSSDPSFDGADDDIFIGYSSNLTFGKALSLTAVPNDKIQDVNNVVMQGTDYAIVKKTGIQFGQKFGTLFAYPQYYIEQSLIPNLIALRNNILIRGNGITDPQAVANSTHQEIYVSNVPSTDVVHYGTTNTDETVWHEQAAKAEDYANGPSYTIYMPETDKEGKPFDQPTDSIALLNDNISNWQGWLLQNEKDKVTASYDENYSFGSGATIENTTTIETAQTYENTFTVVLGGGIMNELGFGINKTGILTTINETYSNTSSTTTAMGNQGAQEVGYHLEENGSNYISISVGSAPSDGFPVFRTKGGVTSCPYEAATQTKYYNPGTALNQPTVQREMPEITVDKPVVSDIAANRPASYTVHLRNTSEIKGDIYFGLNVIDKSNPYGAKIYMDGSVLGAGRDVLIPAGESLTKTITLEKGPDSMNYDNIQLVLHSTCQYNPVVYAHNIADTISLSAHFLPACSDVHLRSPTDQWLLNTAAPQIIRGTDTVKYLPVVLDQYELNKNLFDHIALQYKPSSSPDWITAMKFYTSQATYDRDKSGGAKTVIPAPDKTEYKLLMDNSFADGPYDIRALSVCMDNGQVVAETPSNTVSGIKDSYRPRPYGNPQPANGVLGIGENATIRFNEPLDIGYLNQQPPFTFFSVTGIKNGAAVDSLVAIQLDGQKDFAVTEFDKNLTGKDFTLECWFMPAKKTGGTLLSQGSKKESVELALTDDYHLQARVGGRTFTTGQPLPFLNGQWVHAALEYHVQDSTLSVYYNFNKVMAAMQAPYYQGTGSLMMGKSVHTGSDFFAGQMRNVRLWTRNLSAIELQTQSRIRLSGAAQQLLACYPLSEGRGEILYDKAHSNNARLVGQWKTPEGRSVLLDGKHAVQLQTSQAVITPEMDFTLGLWFKGVPGQSDATLIASGKGDGSDLGGSRNLYCLGFENGRLTFHNKGAQVQVDGNYLDNSWHQVVIAVNRNTGMAQFYVDGQLKKFFDAGSWGGLAATFTYLGARPYHEAADSTVTHLDRFFKGHIDEVRLWNTYLNSTLVEALGNTKLRGTEAGLLAYYPFEMHQQSSSGVWSTLFTPADQKVQQDPNNQVADAQLNGATESTEKAPMKAAGPKVDLAYDFVANNDAISFRFSGGAAELKAIDKTIVTFTASHIRDEQGNYMASPVTWTAYIDQNPLSWADESLNLTKAVNQPLVFESYIVNSGGREEQFHLDNLPAWVSADVTQGNVPPQGKQKIRFTVNKGLNVGTYDAVLEMTNDLQQTQGLALNLKVAGDAPDWQVDPSAYAYNMTVYGKIRINQVFSDNPEDMLGAFIGGKCVGVAHNTYIRDNDFWYVFLTVYSDSLTRQGLTFRLWDAGTGKTYTGIASEPLHFESDAVYGTPRTPVIFDGQQMRIMNLPLAKGWNWLSFNLYGPAIASVGNWLADGSWQSGDIIKEDRTGFDQYSVQEGWLGTLSGLDNLSLFKLRAAVPQTLSISGVPVDVKNTPIPLTGSSWNYISYLPGDNMTVNDALAGYLAAAGDQIKSQTGFAMYDPQLGWIGNLEFLEPGKGYMLYRGAPSDTAFTYPSLPGVLRLRGPENPLAMGRLNPHALKVAGGFAYADNMTVVAAVDPGFHLESRDELEVYAGDELRARTTALPNPVTGKPAWFLNIPGSSSEPLYFVIRRGDRIRASTGTLLRYQSNSRIGSLQEPLMLHFDKQSFSATVAPNPFHKQLTLTLQLPPGVHQIHLQVYNLAGQQVYQTAPGQVQGKVYRMVWNGRNDRGGLCPPGLYVLRLVVDEELWVYKVIKY